MGRYHLTVVRPAGYPHSDCFVEVVEGLVHALRALGHEVSAAENRTVRDGTNVLFGAHLLSEREAMALPAETVLYNLEQWTYEALPSWYHGMAQRVRIWEYSAAQMQEWTGPFPGAPPLLVPIGYVPQLCRVPRAPVQDIDVLFYGSQTPRRKTVLDALRDQGLRLRTLFGEYGAVRDERIARARVVLNLHARDSAVFEVVRVSYLLANAKAVVCEESCDLDGLEGAMAVTPYDELVDTCLQLLQDGQRRAALERAAHRTFSERSQVELLRRALETEARNEADRH